MIYIKNEPSKQFEKALCLPPEKAEQIKSLIKKVYDELPDSDFSVDEVNAGVAPILRTPEEAFYAAQIIITDLIGPQLKKALGKK